MNKITNYNLDESKDKVLKIYYLYLLGFLSFYITNFIGYIIALKEKKDTNNSVLNENHYRYQIKIMNINIFLNIIAILSSLCYGFYIFSLIDFANFNPKHLQDILMSVYIFVGISLFSTILFYIQTFLGIKRLKNNEIN